VELASDPSACAWGPNRLDVFGRSPAGELIHASWDGAAWSFTER
jgi:hypothetical protein